MSSHRIIDVNRKYCLPIFFHFSLDEECMDAAQEVTKEIASKIGKDWKHLANVLQLKLPFFCFLRSEEKNMLKCFEEKGFSWHELKKGLKNIDRNDIVQYVCEKFNLDDGKILYLSHD